jgi:hypothetical protein
MDITTLRSSLQHACSDLRNLTSAELQDAKWLTKKKVYQSLVSCSPSLTTQNEELCELVDRRNDESAAQKRNSASKEERIEAEMNFRTAFMRVVLSGLCYLQWPPTQEAFSDPFDALFNDAGTFLNSVEFLLHVGIPRDESSYNRRETAASTPPKPLPATPGSVPRPKSGGVRPTLSTFDTSLSMISHASSDYAAEEQEDAFDADRSAFAPAPFQSFDDRSRQPSRASMGLGTRGSQAGASQSLREKKLEVNWKAFEVRLALVFTCLSHYSCFLFSPF